MKDLRLSEMADLGAIAKCHMRVFPSALASHLGPAFVSKMLEWYLVSERGVLFQLNVDGRPVGYCGGIKVDQPGLPGAFTSISQYAFWTFVRSILRKPWLVFHRDNLKRHRVILRNILIRFHLKRAATVPAESIVKDFKRCWWIVVVGVDPDFQGKGLGSKLLCEFERLARADGMDCIQLSVKPTNQQAINSYQRNGWEEVCRSSDSMQMRKQLSEIFHDEN